MIIGENSTSPKKLVNMMIEPPAKEDDEEKVVGGMASKRKKNMDFAKGFRDSLKTKSKQF